MLWFKYRILSIIWLDSNYGGEKMITSEKTTKPAAWKGFKGGHWQEEINIRDFIQNNFTQYNGDESFLAGPTAATKTLNDKVLELKKQERAAGGVLDADTKVVATITSHGPGYIQKISKRLLVSRLTSLWSGPSCHLVVFEWLMTLWNHTVIPWWRKRQDFHWISQDS